MRNGAHHTAQRVELGDRLVVAAPSASAAEPRELEFEVVGIVADVEAADQFAVCYCESSDEFVVSDSVGTLLDDERLAQEILNDFLAHADESQETGRS